MAFTRSFNPIWYFVDLQGLQLNDTDYLFILNNQFPYNPQPIFMDPDGNNVWSDPIQFFPNGTLPDNMYWDPDLVYRLEVRAGNSQADQLIYLIENYVPVGQSTPIPVTVANLAQNQITNPQFFDLNFSTALTPNLTITLSSPGTMTVNLAPGWQLVLTTGTTGTAIINSITTLINQSPPANPAPPYALRFQLTGFSSAILQQTFNNIGNLWVNQFLGASALFLSNNNISSPVTLAYSPSSPDTTGSVGGIIATGNMNIAVWTPIAGVTAKPLGPFTSTSSNFGGSVNFQIILPPSGSDFFVSNIFLQPQTTPLTPSYVPDSLERQHDHEFHYFQDSIIMQPKDNLLCGWNFPINPSQFNILSGAVIATQCDYLIDQTILYQQGAGSRVTANDTDPSNNFDLVIGSNNASNQFALIQYISGFTIQPYWSESVTQNLSALVKLAHTGTSPVNFKMRLIWRTAGTLPPTISATEPIASWSSGGDPVFQTGWTAIKPLNDPTYTTSTLFQFFDFNQFPLPNAVASPNNPGTLGIVLYTVSNMQNPGGSVIFDRISLVPNDFAIDCNTRTFDDELEKCQYYYETSYDPGTALASSTANSAETRTQMWGRAGGVTGAYPLDFNLRYRNIKNRLPTVINFYSTSTGTINKASYTLFVAGAATVNDVTCPGSSGNFWPVAGIGLKGAKYNATTSGTGFFTVGSTVEPIGSIINFQYTVDARLGKP